MKHNFLSILLLVTIYCGQSIAQDAVEIFPAKVDHWKQAGPGKFSIKDGVATSQGGMGLWWYSGKSFANATFDINVKLPNHKWNSGIFVRFPNPKNDPWVAVRQGYECQVSGDKVSKLSTGAIYDIQAPSHITLKKPGEWNHYQITTFEGKIIIVINGELVNVFSAQKGRGDEQGYIGIQNHDPISKAEYGRVSVREWGGLSLDQVLDNIGITRADWNNYHAKRNKISNKRWAEKMDLGPAWANTFGDYYQGRERVTTLKGIRLELSQIDSIKGLFDTETLRLSSAVQGGYQWGGTPWTGGHGSNVMLNNKKNSIMETSAIAGWADAEGSFEDSRKHQGHGNFPHDHMQYNGHYRYGSKVVLDYSILNSRVLESISGEAKDGQAMVYRQLQLAPAKRVRSMLVADNLGGIVSISKDGNSALIRSKVTKVAQPAQIPNQVNVIIDKTQGDWNELSMGAPSNQDDVDRAKSPNTYFRVLAEFLPTHQRGGDEEGVAVRLNDGLASRNDDDVSRVFFFEDKKKSGRLEMKFGKATNITRIHLYSQHLAGRAGQDVEVYVSQKADANSLLPIDRLENAGWKKLTSYKTQKSLIGGKYGVAILAPKGEAFEELQKVLFICRNPNGTREHTFFTEIDMYKTKAPKLKELASDLGDRVFCVTKKGVGAFRDAGNGRLVIDFPAMNKRALATIGYVSSTTKQLESAPKILLENSPNPRELSSLTKGGKAAFSQTVTTKGRVSDKGEVWVTDQVGLPTSNPWSANIRPGGFDFFSSGDSAALSTWEGDVWIVTGLNGDYKEFKWRRYATGLYETLGLKIVDDVIYVHGRDQITRLHDQNKDGEADWYECFNNAVMITKNFHEFAFSLQTDKAGNFYITKGSPVLPGGRGFDKILPHNGTIMKISKEGKKLEVVATGLRAPGGLGIGPNGEMTTGENEGSWQPCCKLNYITGGKKFLGTVPSGHDIKDHKLHLPLCYFPMYIDNSGGGQVWVPQRSKWGLKPGELIHMSYGKSSLYRVLSQEINGQTQGGVVRIPVKLKSSAMRARFHPADGTLYVLGFRGWQTNAATTQAFERVRYTGKTVNIPDQLKVTDKGVYIRFEKMLDEGWAQDRFNFKVERWKYIRSAQYGSGEFSIDNPDLKAEAQALKQESLQYKKHDQVEVVSAQLLSDGKTIFLHIPSMKPAEQMSIKYKLSFADGEKVTGEIVNTIHNLMPHTDDNLLSGAKIVKAEPQNLKPGLIQTLEQYGAKDTRVTRLPAQFVGKGDSVSDMLPSRSGNEPFKSTWNGYISLKERLVTRFSLSGKGSATLKLDGKIVLSLDGSFDGEISDAVSLDPGYHQFELIYTGHTDGTGQVRTLWQTDEIPLQSIPTSYFSYQATAPVLKALHIRAGRDLMLQQNCMKCHQAEEAKLNRSLPLLPELSEQGPNMEGIGSRVSEQWLVQWLANAHQVKPTTTMPIFADVSTAKGQVEVADMAAYLARLKVGAKTESPSATMAHVKKGGDKFDRLGCISCHSLPNKNYDQATHRIPLNNVHRKFSLTSLVDFLEKPNRHHSSIKMPDFQLSNSDALEIAAYLRKNSEGHATTAVLVQVKGDPKRGKDLIVKHHCSACHSGLPKGTKQLPSLASLLDKDWGKQGCASSTKPAETPKLNLIKKQQNQLESYRLYLLAHGGAKQAVSSMSLHDYADRQYKSLNCAACHSRDGNASKLSALQRESSYLSDGIPVPDHQKIDQTRPQMTYIGEMLHTEYMRKMLAGKVVTPRPWLGMKMPAFHDKAEHLAKGLAAQHGMAPSKFIKGEIDPKRAEIGKKLIGNNGGFACMICHANGQQKALAAFEVEGINFDQVAQRLRPGYYHRWMENPQSVMPTKMPRYTMKNRSPMPDYQHDAQQQFEAIQEYLKSIHKEASKK